MRIKGPGAELVRLAEMRRLELFAAAIFSFALLANAHVSFGASGDDNFGIAKKQKLGSGQSSSAQEKTFGGLSDLILIAGGDLGGTIYHVLESALFVASTSEVHIYLPHLGQFKKLDVALRESREVATATRLPNGKILIAGGCRCENGTFGPRCEALDTAELYDPAANTFSIAGSGSGFKMTSRRAGHTATLIRGCNCPLDGKVLLAGGINGRVSTGVNGIISRTATDTAELYDPVTDSFIPLKARMANRRVHHVAAPLADGRVLIAGGDDTGFFEHALRTAELFDPRSGSFQSVGSMATPRELAQATFLDPKVVQGPLAGEVLISGGLVAKAHLKGASDATAELFDPNSLTFHEVTSRMSSPRAGHSAVLAFDGPLKGRVLIAGGVAATGEGTVLTTRQISQKTADLYDPSAGPVGAFRPTGSLHEGRGGHLAAFVFDGPHGGKILVAGGENCNGSAPSACYVVGSEADRKAGNPGISVEMYNPLTESWTPLLVSSVAAVNAPAGQGSGSP